jgi:hypothetical protein
MTRPGSLSPGWDDRRAAELATLIGERAASSIVPMDGEFYVYQGSKLVRVCPSIGIAREVAAGL